MWWLFMSYSDLYKKLPGVNLQQLTLLQAEERHDLQATTVIDKFVHF